MNILFGCYNKNQDSHLLISSSKYNKYEQLDKLEVQSKYGIQQIYYTDNYLNLNSNLNFNNSIDIIFLIHCPIYSMFFTDKYKIPPHDSSNPFSVIAENSMRILKKGGRLIIPTYSFTGKSHNTYIPIDSQITLLQRIFKKYRVYHTTRLPFYFKSSDDGEMRGNYLIVENKTLKTMKTKKTKKREKREKRKKRD